MKRKTRATPANTPRSRSKLTRRQRIYGYRVPADKKNLNFMFAVGEIMVPSASSVPNIIVDDWRLIVDGERWR